MLYEGLNSFFRWSADLPAMVQWETYYLGNIETAVTVCYKDFHYGFNDLSPENYIPYICEKTSTG